MTSETLGYWWIIKIFLVLSETERSLPMIMNDYLIIANIVSNLKPVYGSFIIIHHVVPPAWTSLTLSRHSSLLFIAFGKSSGLHPVSSQSCYMLVRAGHLAFAQPYVGVHRSTSLMSSSLLLQQCPACLVCLTLIVFLMGDRWPYSWCFVRCCFQDLFKIACSIFV